jgi:replication factor C subunit 2/4
MLSQCAKTDFDAAYKITRHLWKLGYSAEDIITNIFRVCKTHTDLPEYLKLEFIKEIGLTHMLIVQGTSSLLQMSGLVARLCRIGLN